MIQKAYQLFKTILMKFNIFFSPFSFVTNDKPISARRDRMDSSTCCTPNSKQIHQLNISVYWLLNSYDILTITLISNLPLRKGWSAVWLFSSSEFYLTAEEMESKLVPQNLWRGKYQKDEFNFGTATTADERISSTAGGEQREHLRAARTISVLLWKPSLWQAGVSSDQ